MHKFVTHNQHYPTFSTFVEAITGFFKTTLPREWRTFRDVVSDIFHIIRPQNFRVLA